MSDEKKIQNENEYTEKSTVCDEGASEVTGGTTKDTGNAEIKFLKVQALLDTDAEGVSGGYSAECKTTKDTAINL